MFSFFSRHTLQKKLKHPRANDILFYSTTRPLYFFPHYKISLRRKLSTILTATHTRTCRTLHRSLKLFREALRFLPARRPRRKYTLNRVVYLKRTLRSLKRAFVRPSRRFKLPLLSSSYFQLPLSRWSNLPTHLLQKVNTPLSHRTAASSYSRSVQKYITFQREASVGSVCSSGLSVAGSYPIDASFCAGAAAEVFRRHFRITTTALFNYTPLRRHIIRYNLMRPHWATSSFFKNQTVFGFGHPFYGTSNLTSVYASQLAKSPRYRLPTVWLAYVTRLQITPQRREFMLLYRKKFQYQSRITRYVTRFYRYKVLQAVQAYEFGLILFLVRCWFAITPQLAMSLIHNRLVFINGVVAAHWDLMLSGGDVVQLVMHRAYFLFHRWSSIFHRFRLVRFNYFSNFWKLRGMRPFPKTTSRRIPHWVIYHRIIIEEVPAYVELDFTTLSAVLLPSYIHNPVYYHYFSLNETPFGSIRMYNWKSLV